MPASEALFMPIRLLPPDVSAKIAAGEVIERPASVVKELVENSLDAGATEVSIEVRGGGVDFMRVADNGSGIPEQDVELAFERFATSKLSHPGDLDTISTLGFRGEALPSIAAVSAVTLETRPADQEWGVRMEVAHGNDLGRKRQGAALGTVVAVRHLFREFPARRKFLRTAATEASRVQAVATRFALAFPHVRVRLVMDGKDTFASSGAGDLREAVAVLYSPQVARDMLDLDPGPSGQDGELAVPSGLIGPPSLTRSSRSHIAVFVNGRWVQNRTLGYALEEAYRGFLMERRYPVAVVNVSVPLAEVDVNVHPAKAEVRFRREGPVFTSVQRAVRRTLTAHSPVPQVTRPIGSPGAPAAGSGGGPFWPVTGGHGAARGAAQEASSPDLASHGPAVAPEAAAPVLGPRMALPALRILGQVQSTYIAAEGPDGVYLIDQHAAHERVVFERVRAEAAARSAQAQILLEPVPVELDPRQREMVESRLDLLHRMGFQIEPFGGDAYLLRGVPSLLKSADPARGLTDVLDLMNEGGGFQDWEERAAYSIACHGAIRAGMALSEREMSELVRQLESCRQPHTCPHGRPTMVHMSSARLEREFGRS